MREVMTGSSLAIVLVIVAATGCVPTGDLERGLEAYENRDWETAYKELTPLAAQGNGIAELHLGVLYFNGFFVPQDPMRGEQLMLSAIEKGEIKAYRMLGYRYLIGDGAEQNISEGKRLLKFAAERGEGYAVNVLCFAFANDQYDVPVDRNLSLPWCRVAEERQTEDSDYFLAWALISGDDQEEIKEGIRYLQEMEERDGRAGDLIGWAANRLGSKLAEEWEDEAAFEWIKLAAEYGNKDAKQTLGAAYLHGLVVSQDETRGLELFAEAAEQGSSGALWNLVKWYSTARTVDGQKKAFEYASAAADLGYHWGEAALGTCYAVGRGVPKNEKLASEWFLKAANQGNSNGQGAMSRRYAEGIGILRDLVQAYMWNDLRCASVESEDHRVMAVRFRNQLAREMSPNQIAQAEALARDWTPNSDQEFGVNKPLLSSTGSGTVINRRGDVLTNFHVIDGCSTIKVNGQPGQVVAKDPFNDLAVIRAQIEAEPGLFRKNESVEVGESVIAVGYPYQGLLTSDLQAAAGEVSGSAGVGGDTRYVQISAPVNPGNSGGPLLDSSGNLVGVVSARLDDGAVAQATGSLPQNVNFALRNDTVLSFLRTNKIEYSEARSWWKKDGPEIVMIAREFTVLVECEQ